LAATAGASVPNGTRSKVLFDVIGSPDKTHKLYAGLLREIYNELEYLQVMADMEGWLKNHI
jgi:alpha-beta hydrolase superfamily lysophospholipase